MKETVMKIYYLMPGRYSTQYCNNKKTYLSRFLSPGSEITVAVTGHTMAESLTSATDLALIAPETVKAVINAEQSGFDGVILGAT